MDELLGKKVPFSAQAEQAVIGSILIDPSCVPNVMEKLRADEFYGKLNRDIFDTVYHMFAYGTTIDPVTVLDQMRVRGVYQDNCEQYLAEVMRMTPTAANVLEYAAIVRDRALLRRLGEAADEINSIVYDGSGEADTALEAAERKIYALRQGRNVGGLLPISSVMQTVFDRLTEISSSGNKIPGISTGLADLDRMILGLNKSELILIAARPGMGKTSIALNMALYAGMNLKKTVAIFSLEMSREQLATRLLSRAALIPSQNLQTGQLTERQWREISDAAQTISLADIRIDDNPTLTVADMNAQCRRIQNLDLVVIDYLQLMQGPVELRGLREQEVAAISRTLKATAKELNVPIIALSQLSRNAVQRTGGTGKPQLSDLRESGSIEQDADMVIFIHRPDYVGLGETPDGKETTQIIIAKHRNGEVCDIDMLFKSEQVRFVEPGDSLAAQAESMVGTESAMNSEFDQNTEF